MDVTFRTVITHFVLRDGAPMAMCGTRYPKAAITDPGETTCYRCIRGLDARWGGTGAQLTTGYAMGRCLTRCQILTSNTSTATYHATLSRMIGTTTTGIRLKKNPVSMRGMVIQEPADRARQYHPDPNPGPEVDPSPRRMAELSG
jgi:hypothetical protein